MKMKRVNLEFGSYFKLQKNDHEMKPEEIREILEYNDFIPVYLARFNDVITAEGILGVKNYNAEIYISPQIRIMMKVDRVKIKDMKDVSVTYYNIVVGGQKSLKDILIPYSHYKHYMKIITDKVPKLIKCSKGVPVHVIEKTYTVTIGQGVTIVKMKSLAGIDKIIEHVLPIIS